MEINCKNGPMCFCDGSCKNKVRNLIQEHSGLQTVEQKIKNVKLGLKYRMEDLDRFNLETDEAGGWMQKDEKGEFVKIADVLALLNK